MIISKPVKTTDMKTFMSLPTASCSSKITFTNSANSNNNNKKILTTFINYAKAGFILKSILQLYRCKHAKVIKTAVFV